MATVVSKTSLKIDDLINDTVVSGWVNPDGYLVLVTRGGAEILAGHISGGSIVGELWSPDLTYATGNMVSYAGMLWKALSPNTNKPPFLYSSLWLRLTGEVSNEWSARDPYFDSDIYSEAWDITLKTGTPTVALTTTSGEFESGKQALKVTCASGESQLLVSKEENIVRGGEVITVLVRARLLSSNPEATIEASVTQNDETHRPFPGLSGADMVLSPSGDSTMTTAWATYTFQITCEPNKPRACISLYVSAGTLGGSAIFLIDHILIARQAEEGSGAGGIVVEQTFASAVTPWIITHNKNTKGLSVHTENALGEEIRGDVTYPDDNHIRVDFYHPQTGLARVFN